tara:strand:- start:582 stop:1277 length:696 start_codon:yes stop_codon:yes gene_type:complete
MSYGSMATHYIKINDREITSIKNGGYLLYKAYNEIELDIAANAKAMGVPSTSMTHLNIKIEKGKTYYIKVFPKFTTVGLTLLDEPIPDKKIKKDRVVYADDLGSVKNKTDWTKEKLISHWTENGIEEVEGIYQKVGNQIDYNIAIIKENEIYFIIFLNGSNYWKEGDLLAKLKKTANYGVFMTTWFLINTAKDTIINIDKGIFKGLSEDGKSEVDFIKTFPTYESNIKKNN